MVLAGPPLDPSGEPELPLTVEFIEALEGAGNLI
jgi:hypothetical protein